jgi:hypothetical protein
MPARFPSLDSFDEVKEDEELGDDKREDVGCKGEVVDKE